MTVLDKFRGGHELVPGRELVHHHYRVSRIRAIMDTDTGEEKRSSEVPTIL